MCRCLLYSPSGHWSRYILEIGRPHASLSGMSLVFQLETCGQAYDKTCFTLRDKLAGVSKSIPFSQFTVTHG